MVMRIAIAMFCSTRMRHTRWPPASAVRTRSASKHSELVHTTLPTTTENRYRVSPLRS